MKDGVGIILNPPKEIPVTKEVFKDFTYYEMACFWCNWKVAFYYDDNDDLKMYTGKEDICYRCMKSHRFAGITWYENSSAEMYCCTIPKGTALNEFVVNKLNHLIMR